jgi:hypothetical protein
MEKGDSLPIKTLIIEEFAMPASNLTATSQRLSKGGGSVICRL